MSRAERPGRGAFRAWRPLTLRWDDNDVFGHVNNVRYYALIDTTVCGHLIEAGAFSPHEGPLGFVVDSGCTYYDGIAFPDAIEGALAVERIGTSSVRYRVGIFREGAEEAAAAGHFTHVYVDRATRRPLDALPARLRETVEALAL